MSVPADRLSSYLDDLPAVFREDLPDGSSNALGRFLLAFEHGLTGLGLARDPGLEEFLEGIEETEAGSGMGGVERYFDPGVRRNDTFVAPDYAAPPEFLEWLAGWVAFVPRSDSSVASDPTVQAAERERITRRLIAHAVELYSMRGTAAGLTALLGIYSLGVRIEEPSGWMQLGVSQLGRDAYLDGPPPHFFRVRLTIPPGLTGPISEAIKRRMDLLKEIIELEKPAHTTFVVVPDTDTRFQIERHSTIGVDTLLA